MSAPPFASGRTKVVPTPLARRELTNILLDRLAESGKPVGDAVSPKDGGWIGQPNADGSNFIPYVVLIPGAATISTGPWGDTQADWQCGYSMLSFGVSREQCEWMADTARAAAVTLERTSYTLGSDDWAVLQARESVIGPIQRVDATEPAFYGQTDAVTLWISKELF
jgi:hypothetical protein